MKNFASAIIDILMSVFYSDAHMDEHLSIRPYESKR